MMMRVICMAALCNDIWQRPLRKRNRHDHLYSLDCISCIIGMTVTTLCLS